MATRRTLEDDNYRGGALTVQDKPPVRRYPCFAEGCPMPSTIWPDITQGGSGDKPGNCAWHYGVQSHDIPRVTQVLRDWQCVSYEVNEARRALTGDLACNPAGLQSAFEQAWERMQPQVVGEWEDELKPGKLRNRKGVEQPFREGYADWAKRLTEFLGDRVAEVLSVRAQRRAA
jgi:hypothetical protein